MIKCPFPWTHIVINTIGFTKPCCNCHGKDDPSWHNTDFIEGLNHENFIKVREQLLNNEWPSICKICQIKEEAGLESSRLSRLADKNAPGTDYNKVKLTSLDVKFSNVCNLACRMCNHLNSNKIEKYMNKISIAEIPHFYKTENYPACDNYKEPEKIEFTKHAIENGLELLKVTGGEPFASKSFLQIIDWCIKNNYSKNLNIYLTTNGTKFNEQILKKLSKFKTVKLTISIDGTKDVYNYIRWPGNWDQLNKSVDKLISYVKKYPDIFISTDCSTVLQSYNLFDVANIYNWCVHKKIKWTADYIIKPKGSELCVSHLPKYLLNEAIADIKQKCSDDFYKHPQRRHLIDFLLIDHKESKEKQKMLLETTLSFDKNRNQSYKCLDRRIVFLLDNLC